MRDYKKLEVWQKAHRLTLKIYKEVIPLMPAEEKSALASQLRRSVYSVPMNVVEGCGKNTDKDFCHYLDNSLGSALEVEYTLLPIKDLEYISFSKFEEVNSEINEVKAMLIGFIKFLRAEK
ncbi:four helix bundle protein [Pedobacter sp. SYSU D00535]|uniref:four helix bundle protein n=1 Tax=Pedobacter sp. SYSU D00535 TaxID=2810308 RepID=UPI001A968981|nr:four helix bundle protein [Pedobacter sp. SYSU D00535]